MPNPMLVRALMGPQPQEQQPYEGYFFAPNWRGGIMGLDQQKQALGNFQFNTPSYSTDPQQFQTPEFDGLIDPNWLNEMATKGFY